MTRRVLIIVENLPSPFDRRVWQEATTLREAGYGVSIICPTGKGYEQRYEHIDGIHIYRHPLPLEAEGAIGYALEYATALFWEFFLALRVLRRHGFDAGSAPRARPRLRTGRRDMPMRLRDQNPSRHEMADRSPRGPYQWRREQRT